MNRRYSFSSVLDNEHKKGARQSHLVWPSSTGSGEERTIEDIHVIVEKIEEAIAGDIAPLSSDERKGFYGRSLLLDIPGFDFIKGVSCEYMHTVCLGVIKKCLY